VSGVASGTRIECVWPDGNLRASSLPLVAALALTVFFSVVLALLAALAFLWDQRNRGEDGYDRDALRPLDEEAPTSRPPSDLP
jgi:cbb3-type cytochrome oxidase maturation protein